eukprot:9512033-Alexandrium_andersonii.AAC.1
MAAGRQARASRTLARRSALPTDSTGAAARNCNAAVARWAATAAPGPGDASLGPPPATVLPTAAAGAIGA